MISFDIGTVNLANLFLHNLSHELNMPELCKPNAEPPSIEEISKTLRRNDCMLDMNNVEVCGYHYLGSVDECRDIKKYGLLNLRDAVSYDTALAKAFKKTGVVFDFEKMLITFKNNQAFSINSNNHQGLLSTPMGKIALRFSKDYGISSFLYTENPKQYGTDIHSKPEIISTFALMANDFQCLDEWWSTNSKGYCVRFSANIGKVDLEETFNLKSDASLEIILNSMISLARERISGSPSDYYLILKQDAHIPPEQLIEITPIS